MSDINETPDGWYEKPSPDAPRGSFGEALGRRPSRPAAAIAQRQAAAKAASEAASKDG